MKLWIESLPRGLKRCLEAELLPNTAERVLKEKVSKGDRESVGLGLGFGGEKAGK